MERFSSRVGVGRLDGVSVEWALAARGKVNYIEKISNFPWSVGITRTTFVLNPPSDTFIRQWAQYTPTYECGACPCAILLMVERGVLSSMASCCSNTLCIFTIWGCCMPCCACPLSRPVSLFVKLWHFSFLVNPAGKKYKDTINRLP